MYFLGAIRGRSLDRHDDGLQKHLTGLRTRKWDEEVLERLEKPVGAAKRGLRVKIVGSNPAGPTNVPIRFAKGLFSIVEYYRPHFVCEGIVLFVRVNFFILCVLHYHSKLRI